MTTAIHLATPQDAPRLLTLIEAFHAEVSISSTPQTREAALMPLLEGSPLGAAWLFGPAKAPVGYTVVAFGWSIEMGGMDAMIDELYIRPSVRKRGIAGEVPDDDCQQPVGRRREGPCTLKSTLATRPPSGSIPAPISNCATITI